MYSCTPYVTSVLDGVCGQRHAPAALPAGKTDYPLYRWLFGPQGRSGRVRKISPPRPVQPIVSHYPGLHCVKYLYERIIKRVNDITASYNCCILNCSLGVV